MVSCMVLEYLEQFFNRAVTHISQAALSRCGSERNGTSFIPSGRTLIDDVCTGSKVVERRHKIFITHGSTNSLSALMRSANRDSLG